MPRITLELRQGPHEPAARIGYALLATRIVAHVTLQTDSGWTGYEPGIVDTGAAVSLFPARVWAGARQCIIGATRLGGVVARDECRIDARLATLVCALSDGTSVIGPLTIHAHLADSDDVPLLLGVRDLIDCGVLDIDIRRNQATFET